MRRLLPATASADAPRLIAERGLENSAFYIPFAPREDLVELYSAAIAFVLGVYCPAMPFDDRLHDGETHPEPLLFRGEEWLERTHLRLGR